MEIKSVVMVGCGGLLALVVVGAAVVMAGLFVVVEPSKRDAPVVREEPSPGAPGEYDLPDVPVERRGNRAIKSFYSAKRHVGDVHREGRHEVTFYCGCSYREKDVDLKSCGYEVRKNEKRARRIEFEHVVPASRYGRNFDAWSKGHPDCEKKGRSYKGRDCARRVSEAFNLMEADMFNLQPAIGEVNGDRSNYRMTVLDGEAREYGRCDVEIRDRLIEPRPEVRGDVARTYLYMAWAYPEVVILEPKEREMFARWDREDPPDDWERERARRIAAIQKNTNPFIR